MGCTVRGLALRAVQNIAAARLDSSGFASGIIRSQELCHNCMDLQHWQNGKKIDEWDTCSQTVGEADRCSQTVGETDRCSQKLG